MTTNNLLKNVLTDISLKDIFKILLVQRKEELLSFFENELSDVGYEFLSTTSTEVAFKALEKDKQIQLVIIDGFLDKNSGLSLISKIRKIVRYEWTPLLMTLDHGDSSLVEKAINSGINGILVAPFLRESLLNKIEQIKQNRIKTVLIVDDDPLILDILKNIIEIERFNVLTAESGEKALELLSTNQVNAMISDIIMPGGMSGVDLLKKVKRINPILPILLITGGGHTYTEKELLEAGADGFFRKPFHNIELVKKIRQVIHRSLKK